MSKDDRFYALEQHNFLKCDSKRILHINGLNIFGVILPVYIVMNLKNFTVTIAHKYSKNIQL